MASTTRMNSTHGQRRRRARPGAGPEPDGAGPVGPAPSGPGSGGAAPAGTPPATTGVTGPGIGDGAVVGSWCSVIVVGWWLLHRSDSPPAAPELAGSAGEKPATEPAAGQGHRAAASRWPWPATPATGRSARAGLSDAAPSVRATALGALERLGGAATTADLGAALADPSADRSGDGPASWPPAHAGRAGGSAPWPTPTPRWWRWRPGRWASAASAAAVPALAALVRPGLGPRRPPVPRGGGGRARGHRGPGRARRRPRLPRRQAGRAAAGRGGPGRLRGSRGAEAGLRRCLEDRDWQVRQVAEDLLAPG